MSLAEQGPALPPEPTLTPMSFCQGYPEMTPRDRVLHLRHAYKHGMLYHCVLELGTFHEVGSHEDSDVALKTLERTVRRLFLDTHQDKLRVRVSPDAEVMSYMSIPPSQGLSAALERYRMEQLADGYDLRTIPVSLPLSSLSYPPRFGERPEYEPLQELPGFDVGKGFDAFLLACEADTSADRSGPC
eukprot:4331506-Lingulodinium_polyedra.AAC.1